MAKLKKIKKNSKQRRARVGSDPYENAGAELSDFNDKKGAQIGGDLFGR